MYKNLCLSGGGFSGICSVSALKCLEDYNIFKNHLIKKYVGTSIGSIICFLLVLDYDLKFIIEFLKTFNLNYFFENIEIDNIFYNFGLNKKEEIKKILKSFLFNKFKKNNITFKELFGLTKKKIGIVGTNLSKNREEYFSNETTPDMSVLDAINISISIPIIFTPVIYNQNYYIDGGLTNNFPINYCNKKTTLSIVLHNNKENEIKDITSYLNSIYNNIFKFLNIKNNYNKENTIILSGIKGYNCTNEIIKYYLDNSYIDTKKFISNNNKMLIYSLIIDLIESIFI